jgi:hypothetical protein
MRNTLIEFMEKLREYVQESGTNIAHDERDSSEFVDIFLKQGQTLPIDSVIVPFVCRDCDKTTKEYRDQLCESCHKWHTDS